MRMRKELAELEEDVRRGEELIRRGEDLERRMTELDNRGGSEEELQAMLDEFGEASGEGSAGGKVWGTRIIAKAADDLRLRLRKLSSLDDFLADELHWSRARRSSYSDTRPRLSCSA